MEPLALILLTFFGLASVLSRGSMHQQDALVLARLENMTKMFIEPEVSEAWNERRIIRRRLQAYGSK